MHQSPQKPGVLVREGACGLQEVLCQGGDAR